MTKKFLIVVDTQVDFMMPGGALYVGGAEQIIVPGVDFLFNLQPDEYAGVMFTADTHYRDTYFCLPESEQFPIHCVKDEAGWRNVFNPDLINIDIPVFHMEKGVFSMWQEPNLIANAPRRYGIYDTMLRDGLFQSLKDQDITTIQVFGVASDYCVKWAVDGLVELGFNVEVIEDLCRGIGSPVSDVFEVSEYPSVTLI